MRVEPQTLETKAAQIAEKMPELPEPPVPADGTQIAKDGLTQITASADKLSAYQVCGEREAERLSQSYLAAAAAYRKVDEETSEALGKGETAPSIAPVPVNPNLSPRLPLPAHTGGLTTTPKASFVQVKQAASQLDEADQAASLTAYSAALRQYAQAMSARASSLTDAGQVWDGQAAEAAHDSLQQHRQWVAEMGKAAMDLGQRAHTLAEAHRSAKGNHPTVEQCEEIEHRIIAAKMNLQDPIPLMQLYQAMQTRSEDVQSAYANEATVKSIDAPAPPTGAPTLGPVSHNDPSGQTTTTGSGQGGGGGSAGGGSGGGSGGGGGMPQGGQPKLPETPSVSPASAEEPKSDKQSGGSPSGGSPSGGSPSGGSGSGGGMPSLPGGDPSKDLPGFPDDAGVQPAAADAGGGGGSGGGAGGGGVGAMPLQPAASGPAVGTGPSGGGMAGGMPAAAGGSGGTAGGGMGGGMAPMGGHGQGGGAKEKKRSPGLSPDEVLYTEDREWTENYIGQQAKRRPSADSKDTK